MFPLSANGYVTLEKFQRRLLRKILGPRATVKQCDPGGNVIHYRAITNAQVRRLTGTSLVEAELRVWRIRWFQSFCRDPSNRSQFIAAFFCTMPFESETRAARHPWHLQWKQDLDHLARLDDAAWIAEEAS